MPDIDTEELRRLTREYRERPSAARWELVQMVLDHLPALLDALDAKDRESERLRSALTEAVASFYEPAHPGRPALKAMAWRETVAAWQRTLEASEADRGE